MTISFLYSLTHTRISTSIHSAPMFVGTLSFKPIAKFNASIHFISFPFIFIHIIIESIRMLQHWICSTNIHEIWLKIESLSTCIEMVLPLLSMSIFSILPKFHYFYFILLMHLFSHLQHTYVGLCESKMACHVCLCCAHPSPLTIPFVQLNSSKKFK